MSPSAHIDTFARDHLPLPEQQPDFLFELPELQFPPQLNCATELLDRWVDSGQGDRVCIRAPGGLCWTYAELQQCANRIANVLVRDMGLVPGNRVLLRAPNNPMLAACWFAVMKAGAIAVATMPLLRAKELSHIIDKARVTHALCDLALADELRAAMGGKPQLSQLRFFNDASAAGLEARDGAPQSTLSTTCETAADDICLFAFTSGTTGQPKATMHFHRDVMAACACWPRHVLRAASDDVFIGSPPLAFTFGLGGLVLFPMSVGASLVLLEKAAPPALLEAIPALRRHRAGHRAHLVPRDGRAGARAAPVVPRGGTLRKCVSAGEALPAATRALWKDATGIELIDGIGATEMLHIFISADEAHARPGATGTGCPATAPA